jgi:DNA repair protein RecO (recombination protein O)
MPARESEAIILRTYPLKEADKIVSFFSRTYGKLRGVAARARRLKNPFGTTLEPLSYVRVWFFQRENRELVNIDSCELIRSYFDAQKDYAASVAFGYIAEASEQLLPEHELNEAFFRLLLLVLENMRRTANLWPALTYFDLWAVRLTGLLPPLEACIRCGAALAPGETVFFTISSPGLHCPACVPENAWELSPASRALALQMLRLSLDALPSSGSAKAAHADLRRFLEQRIEAHAERRLVTREALEQIE